MPEDVSAYLAEVKTHLHLEPDDEARVISEIDSHFQDKLADLREGGVDETHAVREALSSFGPPRDVARLMYEAYSRGTWSEAFVSLQPHILVASMFATHLWRLPLVIVVAFTTIAAMAILGWRAGRPVWTYSWAGYAFFPLLAGCYLTRGVPGEALALFAAGGSLADAALRLAPVAALYGITLTVLVASVLDASRSDWIPVSLMLLPLVVLGIWAFAMEQTGDGAALHASWDRSMAMLCVALGVTAAAFVRLRARLLKAVAVVLIGIVTGVLLLRTVHHGLPPGRLVAGCLGLFVLLMSPLVVHSLLARGAQHPRNPGELRAS